MRIGGYASKKYYVYGQTGSPGAKRYTGRDTLLDAVLDSGVDFRSWTSRVKVIRPTHGETPIRTLTIDVDAMVKTGDWSKNVLLEPSDIVYIPPTPGTWFAQRVSEILFPVGPVVQAYTAPAFLQNLDSVYRNDNSTPFFLGTGSLGGGSVYRP